MKQARLLLIGIASIYQPGLLIHLVQGFKFKMICVMVMVQSWTLSKEIILIA